MNTFIRYEVRQWLGLDRQEDRYVQNEHQKVTSNWSHNGSHLRYSVSGIW